MGEGRSVLPGTARGEACRLPLGLVEPGGSAHVGVQGQRGRLVVVAFALDRRGRPDAAGVEADDVEVLEHIVGQRRGEADREKHARAAGAAWIHQQRADPLGLVAVVDADYLDGHGRPTRPGVVDGHGLAPAVEAELGAAVR